MLLIDKLPFQRGNYNLNKGASPWFGHDVQAASNKVHSLSHSQQSHTTFRIMGIE